MSCMSVFREALNWVESWKAHYAIPGPRHPRGLARRLRRTAEEQRANMLGGYRGANGRREYERCVALVERAAERAERVAARFERRERARQIRLAREQRAHHAYLMTKYPARPAGGGW